MFKTKFLFILVCLIGIFAITSCAVEEEETNPFIGTWKGTFYDSEDYSSYTVTLIFTDTTVKGYMNGELGMTDFYTVEGNNCIVNGSIVATITNDVIYYGGSAEYPLYKQ